MGKQRPQRRQRPLGGSRPLGSPRPSGSQSSSGGRPSRGSGGGQRKPTARAATKKRSPAELALVWGGIGLLVVVVIIELAGKLSYNKALPPLQQAWDQASRQNPLKADEAKSLVKRKPTESVETQGSREFDVLEWKWFSFFKTYSIKLIVRQSDQVVTDLQTGVTLSE